MAEDILLDRYMYDKKKPLAQGGFSFIYKAIDKKENSKTVILKILKNVGDIDNFNNINKEFKEAKKLDHENLVKYLNFYQFDSEETGETIQAGILEYVDSGTILDFFKNCKEESIRQDLVLQCLKGLKYLHEKGIVHRDITPSNIMVHSENRAGEKTHTVKIIDFGISKDIRNNQEFSTMVVGNSHYLAPEQFNEKKFGIRDYRIDIWAFGVTLYTILTGQKLFNFGPNSKNTVEQNFDIERSITSLPFEAKIKTLSEPYKGVIFICLKRKVSERAQDCDVLIKLLDTEVTELFDQKKDSKKSKTIFEKFIGFYKKSVNPIITNLFLKLSKIWKPILFFLLAIGLIFTLFNWPAKENIKIDWVIIPAATELDSIGSLEKEDSRDEEGRRRIISNSFKMSSTEITIKQYIEYCKATQKDYEQTELNDEELNKPIVNITFSEARQFAAWCKARLPTEDEWEYACIAKSIGPFNTNNGCLSSNDANFDGSESWKNCPLSQFRNKIIPVKSFQANSFKLFDMHGNVKEWVIPASWEELGVTRGGSFRDKMQYCKSSYRNIMLDTLLPFDDVGFRIVQDLK